MTPKTAFAIVGVVAGLGSAAAQAQTTVKQGTNAAGQTCSVTVTRNPDGSMSAAGASAGGSGASTSTTAGGLSSSSSAGGTSVQVQAGGGSVSSSSSVGAPGRGGAAASTMTVNGCTISTSSP